MTFSEWGDVFMESSLPALCNAHTQESPEAAVLEAGHHKYQLYWRQAITSSNCTGGRPSLVPAVLEAGHH